MKKETNIEEIVNMLKNSIEYQLMPTSFENILIKTVDNKRVIDYILDNYKELKIDITPILKYSIFFQKRIILDSCINHNLLDEIYKYIDIDYAINAKVEETPLYKIIYDYYKSNKNFKWHIPKECLLYKINKKTILEHLIQDNKSIIIKNYLSKEATKDFEIATILMLNGMKISENDVLKEIITPTTPIEDKRFNEFLKETEEQQYPQTTISISPYQEQLLNYFRKLMLEDKDNISNKLLIETIIEIFKKQIELKKPYAERDLELLINIKEENPDFRITLSQIESYYRPFPSTIYIHEYHIHNHKVILHELTHLIHHYYNNVVPSEYYEIKEKIRATHKLEEKYKKYLKQQIPNDLKMDLIIKTMLLTHNSNDYLEKAKSFRIEYKKILKKYSNKYPKEKVEELYNNHFTTDDYIAIKRDLTYKEIITQIKRTYHSNNSSLMNIIDALYDGKIYDNAQEYASEIGIGPSGHGSEYYKRKGYDFKEILASYISIIKSPNSEETIKELKALIGEDLLILLNNFYENIITKNNNKKRTKKF